MNQQSKWTKVTKLSGWLKTWTEIGLSAKNNILPVNAGRSMKIFLHFTCTSKEFTRSKSLQKCQKRTVSFPRMSFRSLLLTFSLRTWQNRRAKRRTLLIFPKKKTAWNWSLRSLRSSFNSLYPKPHQPSRLWMSSGNTSLRRNWPWLKKSTAKLWKSCPSSSTTSWCKRAPWRKKKDFTQLPAILYFSLENGSIVKVTLTTSSNPISFNEPQILRKFWYIFFCFAYLFFDTMKLNKNEFKNMKWKFYLFFSIENFIFALQELYIYIIN